MPEPGLTKVSTSLLNVPFSINFSFLAINSSEVKIAFFPVPDINVPSLILIDFTVVSVVLLSKYSYKVILFSLVYVPPSILISISPAYPLFDSI